MRDEANLPMEELLKKYYGENAEKVLKTGNTDIVISERANSQALAKHAVKEEVDDDFNVQAIDQDEDDEATLEEEEREAAARGEDDDHEDELNDLRNEAEMSMEDILRKYYGNSIASQMLTSGSTDIVASKGVEGPAANILSEEEQSEDEDRDQGRKDLESLMHHGHGPPQPDESGADRGHGLDEEDYQADEDDADDEATLEEEEEAARMHGEVQDYDDDFNDLMYEADMSIEEIMKKYYGGVQTGDEDEQKEQETPLARPQESTSRALLEEASPKPQKDASVVNEDEAIEDEPGLELLVKDDVRAHSGAIAEGQAEGLNAAPEAMEVDEGGIKDEDHGEENGEANLESLLEDEDVDKGEMSAWQKAAAVANDAQANAITTETPFLLKHELRSYQHAGLDWLVAIYEKNLNGILADEMGLGKTIQTVSLLAWLACAKGIWGPHLIVVPTSVMLNWETELKKWCPAFKILTYYGSQKERKLKRQGWSKANSFHVCITTYTLVLQDAKMFRRKKWKYLILDEAHMIKNWRSQRWQTLLNFNSKRRILLTGTPLQNDVMELWSLMHFLMPHIFQSHDQFKSWFSQPLTGMVEGQEAVNRGLVERLHGVLRPFILRRLKVDVEKNLPPKIEHVLKCRLSRRQRNLYEDFMSRSETRKMLSSGNFVGIANCLMQLRKVCNHPDLFEGRAIVSAFDQVEAIQLVVPSLVYNLRDQLKPFHAPLWSRTALHSL